MCSVPRDKVEIILGAFNSYDPHIQFTVEKETERSVPFLDTKLIRTDNNKIILDWYIKPTASGRYINYYSCHSINMKINFIKGLKNRIMKISHASLRNKNLKNLYKILCENSYPPKMIQGILFDTSNFNNSVPRKINNLNGELISYATLPAIDGLTNNLIKLFKCAGVKIAKRNVKTVGNVFSVLKDKIADYNKSYVVYKVPCQHCQLTYIGQTSQLLKSRLTQHKSDINKSKKTACALTSHCIDFRHVPDYNNTVVLKTEKHLHKRLFMEMFYINQEPSALNSNIDVKNLSTIYTLLLNVKHGTDFVDGQVEL